LATALAFAQLLGLAIAPGLIWHRVLGDILASFRWDPIYVLSELSPWLLLIVGIAFLVPVAVSVGRSPESRLYPRARQAYVAWGTVAYVLGLILAMEVTEVWHYTT
jgi:hypothetical protein